MDRLDCMRTFIAVAARRSFTGGAKQLGMSTKLASKYVARLEETLGAQLLNRTTRSVTLTDTGQAYLERCTALIDQFEELEDVVQKRQKELAGPIRITAPTGLGSRELIEALSPFQQAHPDVRIELVLSDRHISILEDGVDLAIRFGTLKDSSLIARKLTDMATVVTASPAYIAAHGEPTEPAALATHNCLLLTSSPQPDLWTFTEAGKQVAVTVNGNFRANSPRAVAHMAACGLGIARSPHYTVHRFLENGDLRRLFKDKETTQIPLYAVYPPNRHLTARIYALIDHLSKAFGGR